MIMSEIWIENFRNFEDLDVKLDNLNVVFGVNDIGKTNLLAAIRFLLDPQSRKIGLVDSDYCLKDVSREIKITLAINISDEEDEDNKKIFARTTVLKTGEDIFYIRLQAKYNHENLFSDIEMFCGGRLDDLEKLNVTQQGRCEIDSIFNVIYIDSSIHLEAVFKRYTRQLFQNQKNLKDDEKIGLESCINNLNTTISQIEAISEFQNDLSEEYKRYREEGLKIKIKSEIEMDNIYSKLIPYISYQDDKTYPTAGDGRKKIVEYSILGMEGREIEKKKINIFLIEEIENHLHRSLQLSLSFQMFEDCLFRHMFITTHSSLIVSRMDNVNLIKLFIDDKAVGKSVKYIVPKAYKKNKAKLNSGLTEAIFAERVLLIEGPSEKILFERVLNDISPKYECKGRYILQVDGVKFKIYYDILSSLGVKCLIKTDNDLQYYEDEKKVVFSGINRCGEVVGFGHTNNKILSDSISKKDFDIERKQYQAKYYIEFKKKIDAFENCGIFLSHIDLENDLYEVVPDTMKSYVKSVGGRIRPVAYLQKAKQNRMVDLCEKMTKKDTKLIYNHVRFKCLKEFVE